MSGLNSPWVQRSHDFVMINAKHNVYEFGLNGLVHTTSDDVLFVVAVLRREPGYTSKAIYYLVPDGLFWENNKIASKIEIEAQNAQ